MIPDKKNLRITKFKTQHKKVFEEAISSFTPAAKTVNFTNHKEGWIPTKKFV